MTPLPALLCLVLAAASASTVWHKALITQDRLGAAARTQTVPVSEEILCAITATHTPWCHLFTHNASGCVMYDVLLDSLADPPPEGQDAAACRTRHRNVCIREGEVLQDGEEAEVECFPHTCREGVLEPQPKSTTCDGPFAEHAVGCVHFVDRNMRWCEARQYCSSLEADLAVAQPENFPSLQQFYLDNAGGQETWVGIKATKWLDGHAVNESEWYPGEPNGDLNTFCARMKKKDDNYLIYDISCDSSYRVVCMRG